MRLRCAVPYCDRTRGERKGQAKIRRGDEWICHVHWRGVDMKTKVRKRWWEKRARRRELYGQKDKANFCWRRAWEWWLKCKVQAIERAAGITA